MSGLVLSLFPGADVLGLGFEMEGFCVVQGPEYVFGRDIRNFYPPAERFDGIIGGDPCQSHSSLANLVRAKGLEPKFPDMTPEYARVIEEAKPAWFLRENVPKAPDINPEGYEVTAFFLDNCWLGEAQMRKRRFWFGWPQERGPAPNLWSWIETATFELPELAMTCCGPHGDRSKIQGKFDKQQAVSADSRTVSVRLGGSGKVKVTAVGGHDGTADAIGEYRKIKQRAVKANEDGTLYGKQWTQGKMSCVTGRHDGRIDKYTPPRRTLAEMLELQGLPRDWLDEAPFTMQAKRKLVGNAVSLFVAKALAKAVRECLESM
jgi:site-specific DNA-cytosine methylase